MHTRQATGFVARYPYNLNQTLLATKQHAALARRRLGNNTKSTIYCKSKGSEVSLFEI